MTDEQFDTLVKRLERQAQENPGGYKAKVLLLALLGNAYVSAMLLLLVAVLVGLAASVVVLKALAVKLIIVVGLFLWVVLKALWVRLEPPVGREVKAAEVPELFAVIEALRRKLAAPRFHHVLITDEFNAGVAQMPRLGIFGWPKNYLTIGLPLMKTLTVPQFTAVLAHELGHLAGGHGRMSNWIYRQRLRWSRLLATLNAQQSRGSFLFRPFLNWFAPYFSAYSFPMARANEYEADANSAKLTSPAAAAAALTGTCVIGNYLEEHYWPGIHTRADDQPHPAFAPYGELNRRVARDLDEASVRKWLDQAMNRQTDSADTHPALADRLRALGASPCVDLPAEHQGADRLLGQALQALSDSFDQRWQSAIAPSWESRYHAVQEERRQLADLNARAEAGVELGLQEAYDRAQLTASVGNDPEQALAQLRNLHTRAPDDATVCLALGARLLERNDAEGCGLVENAMDLDEGTIAKGCELLRDYHWRNGRHEEARDWHQRLAERLQLQEGATYERNHVLLRDRFERHGLPEAALSELRAALSTVPKLRKVYLVRKQVKYFAHLPCYVLGFTTTRWFQWRRKGRAQEVTRAIQDSVRFPGETLIISVEGENVRFGRKFRWMRGARIL